MPKKQWYKVNFAAMVRDSAESEISTVEAFRQHVRVYYQIEKAKLGKIPHCSPIEEEFIADEYWQLENILDLTDQLTIIALHRVVELNTVRIIVRRFGKVEGKKANYIKKLSAILLKQGIKIEKVAFYRYANELRLLNNAIKHDGKVTTELAAAYRRWKSGRKLTNLESAYVRLSARVSLYLQRLAETVQATY